MLKGKLDRSIAHLPKKVNICPSCKEETMEPLVRITPYAMKRCKKEFRTALSKWSGKRICISCANVDVGSIAFTTRNKTCLLCGTRMSRYNLGDLCYCCNDNSKRQGPSDLIQVEKDPQYTFIKGESTVQYISSSSPGKTMKLKGSGGKRRIPVLPCLREEANNMIEDRMIHYFSLEKRYLGLEKDRDRRQKSITKPVNHVYRIEQENLIQKLSGRMKVLWGDLAQARKEVHGAQELLQRVSEVACDIPKLLHPTGKITPSINSLGEPFNKRRTPRRRKKKSIDTKLLLSYSTYYGPGPAREDRLIKW